MLADSSEALGFTCITCSRGYGIGFCYYLFSFMRTTLKLAQITCVNDLNASCMFVPSLADVRNLFI